MRVLHIEIRQRTEQRQGRSRDANFLIGFPHGRLQRRFPRIDATAREGDLPPVSDRVLSEGEQDGEWKGGRRA